MPKRPKKSKRLVDGQRIPGSLPRVNGERIDCMRTVTNVGSIYYGRGAKTGDWYLGLTEGPAELRRLLD